MNERYKEGRVLLIISVALFFVCLIVGLYFSSQAMDIQKEMSRHRDPDVLAELENLKSVKTWLAVMLMGGGVVVGLLGAAIASQLRKIKEDPPDPEVSEAVQLRDKNATFKQSVRERLGEPESLFSQPDLEKKVNHLINTFNPDQGMFTGWFKERRTAQHSEILRNLSENERHVINQHMMLAQAVREGKTDEILFKTFVEENVITLMNIEATAKRIEIASEEGIPEIDYTRLKVADREIDVSTKAKKADIYLDLEKEQGLSDIRLQEKREEAAIEWERYHNEKKLDIQAAILAGLAPVAEVEALRQHLLRLLKDIEDFKQLPQTADVLDSIRILKKNKKKLEKAIDERFQGLLQSHPRKKVRRLEEDSENTES